MLKPTGHEDPDVAKEFCPNSIRAKYGTNQLENLILCSTSVASVESVIEL